MTEQELRLIVRDAIAQQLGRSAAPGGSPAALAGRAGTSLSHAQFAVPSGPEGTCIIEPSVMCTHCGYCKSYGH